MKMYYWSTSIFQKCIQSHYSNLFLTLLKYKYINKIIELKLFKWLGFAKLKKVKQKPPVLTEALSLHWSRLYMHNQSITISQLRNSNPIKNLTRSIKLVLPCSYWIMSSFNESPWYHLPEHIIWAMSCARTKPPYQIQTRCSSLRQAPVPLVSSSSQHSTAVFFSRAH